MTAPRPIPGSAEWTRGSGRDADAVLTSRVRLARNLAGFPFPNAARDADKRKVLDLVRDACASPAFEAVDPGSRLVWIDINQTPQTERLALVERHLISRDLARGADPRAVAVSMPGERLAIMVNEEDHLRLQTVLPGLALADALALADRADDALEARLPYAFSPTLGYLTACPTNVGDGIRVSVMLHLPALKIMHHIDKVRRAAKAMNLALRGFYGEGTDFVGDLYQLSNQTTLGRSEREILDDFQSRVVPEVIDYERHAREALLSKRRLILEDLAHRALGLLRHARLLSAEEALQHLSMLRLGLLTGVIPSAPNTPGAIDLTAVNELFLLTQPAHIQRALGRDMDQAERRVARANLVRHRLGA